MRTIVKMKFGSHVYGSNIEGSDEDIKVVYIPDPKTLLLSSGKNIINNHSEKEDYEAFPLREFLRAACAGQTFALDMLHTPKEFWLEYSDEWLYIVQHKKEIISQNLKPFIGYAKNQALRYSIKGNRLNMINHVITILKNSYSKYNVILLKDATPLLQINNQNDLLRLKDIKGPQDKVETHLEVCGKFFPLTASIEYVIECLEAYRDKYGERAQEAAEAKGEDRKALYHAVRVCYECLELLETGKISFPRPEKNFLLDIRKGIVGKQEVCNLIEHLNQKIEEKINNPNFLIPKEPSREFWEDYIYQVYKKEIINEKE